MKNDKIVLLRELLATNNIDAFLIPSWDEFQGEYVADYAKRLEYICGFNGSNGFLVVTKKQAAFFTDGRYILQARNQLSQDFEIYDYAQYSVEKWCKENLRKDAKIGYDSKLFSLKQASIYIDANYELKSVNNLVDSIWQDKPKKPDSIPFIYDIKYAGKSWHDKLQEICKIIKDNESDAYFLSDYHSICWLLNIRGRDLEYTPIIQCYAIIDIDGVVEIFTHKPERFANILGYFDGKVIINDIALVDMSITRYKDYVIGVDRNTIPMNIINQMAMNECVYKEYQDPCLLPKAIKNDIEINNMKIAHKKDAIALNASIKWLKENYQTEKLSEYDFARKLDYNRSIQENFVSLSFAAIVGYGSNGAIVHYKPSNDNSKIIGNDSLLLIDSGGQYLEGTTDITRTICLGEPNSKQKHFFTLVLKGHIAVANHIFPKGTTGKDLDILARQYLKAEGFDYAHGTGHGVGCCLGVHEPPQGISKYNDIELQAGMIISNEPGVYLENEFGIRVESLVIVINKPNNMLGFETISLVPIEENMIDFTLITVAEKQWIDNYNYKLCLQLNL
jgi:Xaa-Pro aminopeptidase